MAVDTAIVTVVPAEGLADVFNSLGATAVISGGRSMNPSTEDLLQAVESVSSERVIILPNNINIVPAVNQVRPMTGKLITIVPSATIPQGISALIAYNFEERFENNVRLMTEALSTVQTIKICRAARPARIAGLDIKKKQAIGFLEGELMAVSDHPADTLRKTLDEVKLEEAGVVTIYYGADTDRSEAEAISKDILHQYHHLQVEVVYGGQPYYEYIASVE